MYFQQRDRDLKVDKSTSTQVCVVIQLTVLFFLERDRTSVKRSRIEEKDFFRERERERE